MILLEETFDLDYHCKVLDFVACILQAGNLDFFIQMSEMSQKHVQAKRFHMRNHRHKNLD